MFSNICYATTDGKHRLLLTNNLNQMILGFYFKKDSSTNYFSQIFDSSVIANVSTNLLSSASICAQQQNVDVVVAFFEEEYIILCCSNSHVYVFTSDLIETWSFQVYSGSNFSSGIFHSSNFNLYLVSYVIEKTAVYKHYLIIYCEFSYIMVIDILTGFICRKCTFNHS